MIQQYEKRKLAFLMLDSGRLDVSMDRTWSWALAPFFLE